MFNRLQTTTFSKEIILEVIAILLVFVITAAVNSSNYTPAYTMERTDIHTEFDQAFKMTTGINPYEKILSGNLLTNSKYATLFPLYYYFLIVVIFISTLFTPAELAMFAGFINVYHVVIQAFEFIGFLFLYAIFREKNQKFLGFAAASFFLLNRWNIANVSLLKQDVVAIAFLLAALYFLDKRVRTAYLLYGISLGIKHLGIFALPIFLTPLVFGTRKPKEFIKDVFWFLIPVLVPILPFLFLNLKAFYLSMIFSFTRKPASACGAYLTGFERLLVNYDNMGKGFAMFYLTLPRLPLVIFTVFNVCFLFLKRIDYRVYISLAFLIFTALNPVYFDQYMVWMVPFALFPALKK